MNNELLKRDLNQLQLLQLPRWTDLPGLNLYMDQVVSYINQYLEVLDLDSRIFGLTPYF